MHIQNNRQQTPASSRRAIIKFLLGDWRKKKSRTKAMQAKNMVKLVKITPLPNHRLLTGLEIRAPVHIFNNKFRSSNNAHYILWYMNLYLINKNYFFLSILQKDYFPGLQSNCSETLPLMKLFRRTNKHINKVTTVLNLSYVEPFATYPPCCQQIHNKRKLWVKRLFNSVIKKSFWKKLNIKHLKKSHCKIIQKALILLIFFSHKKLFLII